MAFRTGVNIVMHALTGNYKADQVHVPALLGTARAMRHQRHELVDRLRADAAGAVLLGCGALLAVLLVGYLLYRALARRAAARRGARGAARGARQSDAARRSSARASPTSPSSSSTRAPARRSATGQAQTAAIKADLEAKLGKIPNLQVKWVPAVATGR